MIIRDVAFSCRSNDVVNEIVRRSGFVNLNFQFEFEFEFDFQRTFLNFVLERKRRVAVCIENIFDHRHSNNRRANHWENLIRFRTKDLRKRKRFSRSLEENSTHQSRETSVQRILSFRDDFSKEKRDHRYETVRLDDHQLNFRVLNLKNIDRRSEKKKEAIYHCRHDWKFDSC